MSLIRGALIGFVSSILSLGLLLLSYPWSETDPDEVLIKLASYICIAGVIGLIVGTVVGCLLIYSRSDAILQGILAGVITVGVLFIVTLLLGPYGFEIPGTRVRWYFFAEWNFLMFFFYVAIPISFVSSIMVWWMVNRKQKKG